MTFKLNRNPSLRVAFIDEVEAPTGNGTTEKTYYSVLVKGGEKYDEVHIRQILQASLAFVWFGEVLQSS